MRLISLLFIIVGLAACTNPRTQTVTLFAAASLTEAFSALEAEFEAANPTVDVLINFAGSQALRLQLEQGAQADVFVSANRRHAEALAEAGLVETPLVFVHNWLVVIVPADNPAGIESLADLTQPGIKLVLAGPDVPVGQYAREALTNLASDGGLGADFAALTLANVVSEEDNVKAVLAKVRLGEADAGIVYTSDVTADVQTIPIPPNGNVRADYFLAHVIDSPQPELAQQLMDFILSPNGQDILTAHGFTTP